MQAKLFIGAYQKADRDAVLKAEGYRSCIAFDGSLCKTPLPFCLSQSDAIFYHLAGFMTILEKKCCDTRPILLYNVTEYLDEDCNLAAYISKLKKFGTDILIFSENNTVAKSLILSVRVVDYSKELKDQAT